MGMGNLKDVALRVAKMDYIDELKEAILLDTLYIQSNSFWYSEKVSEIKWSMAVEIAESLKYSPEHEKYYEACDTIDEALGNYVESQTSEILEKFLDNLK